MEIIHILFEKNNNINKTVAVAIDQLASEQLKMGYSVKLWEITEQDHNQIQERRYPTQLFHINGFIGSNTAQFIKEIKTLKKDTIVHIHGGFIPIFFSIAFQLKKRNIPFVYTTHGTYNKKYLETAGILKKLYFHSFEQLLVQWSSAMQFEGIHEKELFIENGNDVNKKVAIIPLGLTNTQKLVAPKIKKNIIPIFGYIGNLNIEKSGLDILLYAFAEYKHKYMEKGELWIVGEGKEQQDLQLLAAQLEIEKNVQFIPRVLGNAKVELLNKVDVFVMPTRYEYDPFIMLEAAAASIPLIVSEETNMGEYIKAYDAGYVLHENTPNMLAKAFIACLKDHQNHQWDSKRRNAYRMVNEKFQWNSIAKEHIDLYEKVLVEQVA